MLQGHLHVPFHRAQADYSAGEPDWFTVEVDGVMTAARRRIHVPLAALRTAMAAFPGASIESVSVPELKEIHDV